MNILEAVMSCILLSGGFVYFVACLAAFAGHFKSRRIVSGYTPSVSVIIAARNEEGNIGSLLNDLLMQDYPHDKFRLIVVDDCSEDGTKAVVESFIARYDRVVLRETCFSKSKYTHKKKAIHEGILTSKGEIIFTVDADCRINRGWLRGMVEQFVPGVDLVAGTVIVEGSGLLGWLEELEFTGIQMMAAGLMNVRIPITCNGANLAYRRSAFESIGGFEGIGSMVSGDDDLLMQKIAAGNPSSVMFASGAETAVHVQAKNSVSEFLAQRSRWASKTLAYPSRAAVAFLSFIFVFLTVIPIWLVGGIFGAFSFTQLVVGYGLKVAGDLLLCGYGVMKYRRPWLLILFPLAEIVHVPYIIGVTVKGLFGSFEWRGRRTSAVSKGYEKNVFEEKVTPDEGG